MDPILFWSNVALEAHRRDYTFDDDRGDDETGTPMDRQTLTPMQGGPTRTSRALAIIYLAMYDALHAVSPISVKDTKLSSYLPDLPAPPAGASADAAVAGAAATAIQLLFGGVLADQRLTEFRLMLLQPDDRAVPPKPPASWAAIEDGLAFGARVGRRHVDDRAEDGSHLDERTYRPMPVRGAFRPDPYAPDQSILGVAWGKVTPFGGYDPKEIIDGFVPPLGRDAIGDYLDAAGWPAELQEVRESGAAVGTAGLKRTAEQTLIGVFWGYDGVRNIGVPPRLYNQCLDAISRKAGLSTAQNAVLFAAANLAMADAGIAAWEEKYKFHVARPVTGVREADIGFGPDRLVGKDSKPRPSAATFPGLALPTDTADQGPIYAWLEKKPASDTLVTGDAHWAPLGAPQTNTKTRLSGKGFDSRTPPFPAYPSGHATFGTVTFEVARRLLENFYKGTAKDFTFEVVSDEYDGKQCDPDGSIRPLHRRTLTLAQAIHENAVSRVYLGVHWRMDAVEGIRLGLDLVDKIAAVGKGPAAALQPVGTPAPVAAA
jgi:hypothetical protein